LAVYGPSHDGIEFGVAFDQLMRPPFFPIRAHEISGDISFTTLDAGTREIAGAVVTSAYVPHTDTTFGYRIERNGVSVAYVSDHQQSEDGESVAEEVLELCRGVDVLIHDAQFTPEEYALKSNWGHCTVDYAVRVAAAAEVGRLVLFHHDPSHDDDTLDLLLASARQLGREIGVEQIDSAYEGLSISLA